MGVKGYAQRGAESWSKKALNLGRLQGVLELPEGIRTVELFDLRGRKALSLRNDAGAASSNCRPASGTACTTSSIPSDTEESMNLPSPQYLLLCLLHLLAVPPVLAQTLNLKGRVLDRANLQGVPGALVKVAGATTATLTDSAGRFTLTGGVGVRPGELRPGSAGKSASPSCPAETCTWRPPEGSAPSAWSFSDSPAKGCRPRPTPWSRAGTASGRRFPRQGISWASHASPWEDGAGSSAGDCGGTGAGAWSMGALGAQAENGGSEALAKTAAAAGNLEISAAKLVGRTVAYASDVADLGDIVLEYPARKLGVGATPIYGATVLFDGTRGRAAAVAELQGNWQDWPRYSPSEPKFRIARDPQFPTDSSRTTLQSCCETNWGYDDIQAKAGLFADAQIHVEYIGMGAYDTPNYDPANPNPNLTTDAYINSGVYVASRYEVQIQSFTTDPTKIPGGHDMGFHRGRLQPHLQPEQAQRNLAGLRHHLPRGPLQRDHHDHGPLYDGVVERRPGAR